MGQVTVVNLLDTHVAQDAPLTNYNLGGSLYVRQWSGSIRVGYLYFSRPFPLGATITSATLHLYGYAKPVSGAIELYLRRLNQTISYPKVNWNSRATAFVYPEATASKSGTYADREEWEFDIKAQMQAVADGAKWYGFQLGSDWATETWSPRFMASNHPNPDLRPWVEITWSDAPDTPSRLSPSGSRVVSTAQPMLRYDYVDVSGSKVLGKAQVQIDTVSNFASPDYDSGEQSVDGPEWDLTGSAFTATEGTLYYWRVRVADEANLWSGWSAGAPFSYRALPTFAFQNPPDAPNNIVEEPTPPITWNVLTGAQESYSLDIYRRVNDRWSPTWRRGRTMDADADGLKLPVGALPVKDSLYLADLRIWDDYDREDNPNGRPYALVSRQFTYEFSALTTPVTALSASGNDPYPGMTIEWDRATAPDSYSVIRDGVIIASELDPDDDTFVSGIHNRWVDRFPVKGKAHTYSVQAVVNGKASASNPTVVGVNRFLGTWLVDSTEDGPMVCLVQDKDRTFEFGEAVETYEPLGSDVVITVTQSMRGYQGEQKGQLRSDVGVIESADTMRERLLSMKSYAGQLVYLFTTGMTFPVVLAKVQVYPLPNPERAYGVSFTYYQQGDLPYTPRL